MGVSVDVDERRKERDREKEKNGRMKVIYKYLPTSKYVCKKSCIFLNKNLRYFSLKISNIFSKTP